MRKFITIISLILVSFYVTCQDVPDNTVNGATAEPTRSNCTTARAQKGLCVERQICDYGTPGIDQSLYAPRGYKRTCKMQEVCCPLNSIILLQDPGNQMNEGKELNFDDDKNDD